MGKNRENITGRLVASPSHTIIMNPRTAINEIVEPIDETTFHVVYASG